MFYNYYSINNIIKNYEYFYIFDSINRLRL